MYISCVQKVNGFFHKSSFILYWKHEENAYLCACFSVLAASNNLIQSTIQAIVNIRLFSYWFLVLVKMVNTTFKYLRGG
jgi:hypothetical protein